jgi:hypothetical protein
MTAKLIGEVEADGEGGDVFEEDGVWYVVIDSMVIGDDDVERVERTRSDSYASLDELKASLPHGAKFLASDG